MQITGIKFAAILALLSAVCAYSQTTVAVINGGTGASTAAGAIANLINGNTIAPSQVNIGSNIIIPATAIFPYMGAKTYSGSGAPTDPCSSTQNTFAVELNSLAIAYQCSNATGSYAWNNSNVTGLTQLTGDGTAGPGVGSQVFTLATVNSNTGTCGDSTHVGQVTLNAKGLATACTAVLITEGINQLTGDVTAGPGNGSQAATLAAVGTSGSCGDATHSCSLTFDSKGRETAQSNVATFTSGSGWVKDPTGHIHQWQEVSCGSSATCTVTFPVTCTTTTGLVIVPVAYYPGGDTGYFTIDSNTPPTITQATLHQNNLTSMPVMYMVDCN